MWSEGQDHLDKCCLSRKRWRDGQSSNSADVTRNVILEFAYGLPWAEACPSALFLRLSVIEEIAGVRIFTFLGHDLGEFGVGCHIDKNR